MKYPVIWGEIRNTEVNFMEEGGMTDLQFKSYLRLLILHLEHIEQAETVEKKREEIDKLISLLQHTIES